MRSRNQFSPFVDASGDYIVELSRGQFTRKFRLPVSALVASGAVAALLVATIVGAAAYLIFRDELLAGLIDRQTQMQYAYEDRIAALRLRLDQLASRQFIDQDSVEGKVQNLVVRQAQLETRAAVVAQLLERTIAPDAGVTLVTPAAREPSALNAVKAVRAGLPLAKAPPIPAAANGQKGALEAAPLGYAAKPEPEGLELRLGDDDSKPLPLAPSSPAPKRGEGAPVDTSMAPRTAAPSLALAHAADPGAPMPLRLESLAVSLDHVERDQARRLSGIVRPAIEAASRLRQAFDIAGVSVDRYIKRPRKDAALAVGGPFVAAPARASDSLFERDLAAAQTAVATLDGLRRALPTTPLRKPLAGELQFTSTFGYRTDPFFGRPALHSGVDLREDYGAPVKATAAGTVSVAGPQGGYGNLVEIDHGGGMSTRYGHLSAINVFPGQQVGPGAVVGRVGSTGRSTGPHLHYEVRIDGEAVDPSRFLKAASALGGIVP
ncbi:peptidoglycan DD-metalloendopeptidase family protein [Methylocystis iwaonis]|uniref:peptidoglycan DD-metalloendopeptidase family protein n=1 Tax=Methylocystis iwaonis TaxID=2885079 RepID=UPI002E7BC2B5|nr:peptidoglycan DD-metalloendopeptidase family protein [Methylocystis iwaonis]